MRAHQKRFKEALKRLNREIHQKATSGLYSRPNSSRVPLKSLEGKAPASGRPVHTPPSPTARKARRIRQTTAERKVHAPQEPESFHSANPRNLVAMLKIPRDAPLTAKPQEVGPVLLWTDRNFLDFEKMESQLASKTFKFHQLVSKQFPEVRASDVDHVLPLDYFDCYNDSPVAEIALKERGERAHGETRVWLGDDDFGWVPCTVIRWISESLVFEVELDDRHSVFDCSKIATKEISRFNLRFDGEDLDALNRRKELAEQIRFDFERYLRTITFLDSINSTPEMLEFMNPNLRETAPEDALQEVTRTQKMQILRGTMQIEEYPKLREMIHEMGIDMCAYLPLKLKDPIVLDTRYRWSLDRILGKPGLCAQLGYFRAFRGVHHASVHALESIESFRKDFFQEKLLTVSDWLDKINEYRSGLRAQLCMYLDDIVASLENRIPDVLNSCDNENLLKKGKEEKPYLIFFNQGKTDFTRLTRVLRLRVKQFAIDALDENRRFFEEMLQFEWPDLEISELCEEGITVISSKITEQSTTNKKPQILTTLSTKLSEVKALVDTMYSSLAEELSQMISPLCVLFERSKADAVYLQDHSRFEAFLLTNDLYEFEPQRLCFSSNEITEYCESNRLVFLDKLSEHLNKAFSLVPTLTDHANKVIAFFTRPSYPIVEETYECLCLLNRNRQFFLKIFPKWICFGIIMLSFDDLRENIDVICKDYRTGVLSSISADLVVLMDNLHVEYSALCKKLKASIANAEQWSALMDVLDSVPETRKHLEEGQARVTYLYDLLFSLFYGLTSDMLVKYLNVIMWPVLIDMELGKTLSRVERSRESFKQQIPQLIVQLNQQSQQLSETIKKDTNVDVRQQHMDFLAHLKERIAKMGEIQRQMETANYAKFDAPRVKLWCLVSTCQEMIYEWENQPIEDMDFYRIKKEVDGFLGDLRALTKSFRKDPNSLRLLISTKSDLEQLLPKLRVCAQIMSSKLKDRHKEQIVKILGFENYPQMTIAELKEKADINQKVPELSAIYRQSKNEDKTDLELISCERAVYSAQVTFSNRRINNIPQLSELIREQKTILSVIQAQTDLPPLKMKAASKLMQNIRQIAEVLDLLGSEQALLDTLAPMKNVSSMKEQVEELKEIMALFEEQMANLNKQPLLISYASRQLNVINLKSIQERLHAVQKEFIKMIAQMRKDVPRLILVPDSQIINIFADDLKVKSDVLSLMFPGVSKWVITPKGQVTALITDTNDTLILVDPVLLTDQVVDLIPKVESTLVDAMKFAFFKSMRGEVPFEELPLQLCFLRLLIDTSYVYDDSNMTFQKKHLLRLFRKSIIECSDICLKAHVKDDAVFVTAGNTCIPYGFQMGKSISYLYSDHTHKLLHKMLASYDPRRPLLMQSQMSTISTTLFEKLSFLLGKSCCVIHPTLSTPIQQIPGIITQLASRGINVCLHEIEMFSLRQMFEIAMLGQMPFFCSLTTNSIPSILMCGKNVCTVDSKQANSHLKWVLETVYPEQREQHDYVVGTLGQYVHFYLIERYIEMAMADGKSIFGLDFLTDIRMMLPPEVFDEGMNKFVKSEGDGKKRTLQLEKVILSTEDFVKAVDVVSEQFKSGTPVMLVAGPQFSGITTCIEAAAQSSRIKYISLAFASRNWIKLVTEALSHDNSPLILHILVPFDHLFFAHSSSLMLKGLVCDGENSLLMLDKNTRVVFEMITPITSPIQIPIPTFTFSTPLVKSSELLNYWMVNKEMKLDYAEREYIRETVSSIVESSLQLYIFFNLFVILLQTYPNYDQDSLAFLIGYCIFWSRCYEFKTRDEFEAYSTAVKSKVSAWGSIPGHIFEYMYQENASNEGKFELSLITKSPFALSNDDTIIANYSEYHCGAISLTNIPCIQFVSVVQQFRPMLTDGKSCVLIGPPGSGRTTIAQYISSRYYQEPEYITLFFDGRTLTTEELYSQLLSISVITIEGIIEPKNNADCIVVIDNMPLKGQLYGAILSIIKTDNAIINQKVRSFKGISFLLTTDVLDYQLSTCCFVTSLVPYSNDDYTFITRELMTRILLKRYFTTAQITQYVSQIPNFLPEVLRLMEDNPSVCRHLHFLYRVVRSVENIGTSQISDLSNFLFWKIREILPLSIKVPESVQQFELAQAGASQTVEKSYYYVPVDKEPQFENVMFPFIHLFYFRIELPPPALSYVSFVLDTIVTPSLHAVIVNDLNLDYEMLTQFGALAGSAQYVVYHSIQQLQSIIRDSICSPQPIVLFCRKPDPALIAYISTGLVTSSLPALFGCLNDNMVIEKLDSVRNVLCRFPYASLGRDITGDAEEVKKSQSLRRSLRLTDSMSTFNPELSSQQSVTHRVRPSDFNFLRVHMFRNVHIFMNVSSIDDIPEESRHVFSKWDKSDLMPKTDSPMIQRLFNLMLSNADKSFVKMIHQLPKVITRFDFLVERINKYIDQRHLFVQQVLVVVKAIEQAIKDTASTIEQTKEQLEMDQTFLATHKQAVEYRQNIVVELTGELARNNAEMDVIKAKDAEYEAYKQKDSANTAAALDAATKVVVKAFTQEEQYKLYIQQNPSRAIRHLFNAYCILREFTPRDDNDYWPEARVLLKSGRFHRTITVFDKNAIKKETILQFDVMMNSPLIKPENFPEKSACRALAVWIAAVHKHTQSTSFNSTVSQQMLELMKQKSRKEKEIADLEDKLKAAQDDLEKHERSLVELQEKIANETELLVNLTEFNEKAQQVSKCFPVVKEDLNAFCQGEEQYGQNLHGFVLATVAQCVVLPLFPSSARPSVEKNIQELLQDSQFESTFFVSIRDIIGSDDPLVLAILSGDRLITVFDPHDTEWELLGGDGSMPLHSLSTYNFVYTDPSYPTFQDDIRNAAECGSIAVIHHADKMLSNPFLNAIASSAVTSAPFFDKITNIDSDFRVVFLIDRPPKRIQPHMTFMHCAELNKAVLESIIMNDELPLTAFKKKENSSMMLHAQRENLYLSLQLLNGKLEHIHSAEAAVLTDVLLQSQLLSTSMKQYNDSIYMNAHALDGHEWVSSIVSDIISFLEKLQDLYRISPLYLWPFSKIRELLEEIRGTDNFMRDLLELVASAMLSSHRWGIDDLAKATPRPVVPKRLNIFHFQDIACAAEYLLNMEGSEQHHFSIEEDEKVDCDAMKAYLQEGSDVIVSFFCENCACAHQIDDFIASFPVDQWHEKSRLFLLTDTSFEFPAHLVNISRVFALE